MAGWIRLYRDIEKWEWIDDSFVYWVFTRMVLMANHESRKWQGTEIKRGSFVTSSDNLALKFKCSRQQIRTVLTKLKSTNELTIKTTSKYSIITITNYEMFQTDNQQSNHEITSEQPASNQQITTTKELNNYKNYKNKRNKKVKAAPNANALLVLEMFNRVTSSNLSPTAPNLKEINARLGEIEAQSREFDLNDFETVVMSKHGEWAENVDMAKYVRPSTLFGGKFEGYLAAAKNKPKNLQEKLADFFKSEGVEPIQL